MADGASHCVQTREQFGAIGNRLAEAPARHYQDVGQRHAHQGLGGGKWHRSRHVAHRVVLHAMDAVHRIGMGGFTAGGDAAPLVDRHIHNHRTSFHALHQLLANQPGGAAAGQQHRANQQIGARHQPFDQPAAAHQAHQATAAVRLQAAQFLGGAIQQEHLRIHRRRHPSGIPAHDAGPQHHHPGGPHAGATAHQNAAAAVGLLQQVGTHLGRQPTGDLAHRCQQRQAAVFQLHRLVGHGGGARRQQRLAHLWIGGQVQVGEQHQIGPQESELLRLGFLHLHHQVGGPGLLAIHQPGAGGGVIGVRHAGPSAGTGLHPHLHALANQLPHAIGGEGHPLFVALDLRGHANAGHRGGVGGRSARHCHLANPGSCLHNGLATADLLARSGGGNRHPPTAAKRPTTHLQGRGGLAPFELRSPQQQLHPHR